jgi:hypothetical protein
MRETIIDTSRLDLSDVPYYVIDFTTAGIELLQVLLKALRSQQ